MIAAQFWASRLDHHEVLWSVFMNVLVWLIVGGVIGSLASFLVAINSRQNIVLNVVVGIVGALLAGWFLFPLVGLGTIDQGQFSLPALLVSFIGAAILLAMMNLIQSDDAY